MSALLAIVLIGLRGFTLIGWTNKIDFSLHRLLGQKHSESWVSFIIIIIILRDRFPTHGPGIPNTTKIKESAFASSATTVQITN